MERPDLIILDESDSSPTPTRAPQVSLWAIMAAVVAAALVLALVRGWEFGSGLAAAWAATLLALTGGLARVTGRSRVRSAAIVAAVYPWLALAAAGGLMAYRRSSDLGPVAVEGISILVRVILVGVPAALVANYYLIFAEAYPIDAPIGSGQAAQAPRLRLLVAATVASWVLGLAALALGLSALA